MKALRTASFWISVIVLPGGILLLTPKMLQAIQWGRQRWRQAASTN